MFLTTLAFLNDTERASLAEQGFDEPDAFTGFSPAEIASLAKIPPGKVGRILAAASKTDAIITDDLNEPGTLAAMATGHTDALVDRLLTFGGSMPVVFSNEGKVLALESMAARRQVRDGQPLPKTWSGLRIATADSLKIRRRYLRRPTDLSPLAEGKDDLGNDWGSLSDEVLRIVRWLAANGHLSARAPEDVYEAAKGGDAPWWPKLVSIYTANQPPGADLDHDLYDRVVAPPIGRPQPAPYRQPGREISNVGALAELLVSLFGNGERLRRFLGGYHGLDRLVGEIAWERSISSTSIDVAQMLIGRAMVNDTITLLVDQFPGRRADIYAVATRFDTTGGGKQYIDNTGANIGSVTNVAGGATFYFGGKR